MGTASINTALASDALGPALVAVDRAALGYIRVGYPAWVALSHAGTGIQDHHLVVIQPVPVAPSSPYASSSGTSRQTQAQQLPQLLPRLCLHLRLQKDL
jgi:hypothetical protein